MVEVGILTVLFVLEVLKYGKAYELLMGERLERWWVVIAGAIGVFVFFLLGIWAENSGKIYDYIRCCIDCSFSDGECRLV